MHRRPAACIQCRVFGRPATFGRRVQDTELHKLHAMPRPPVRPEDRKRSTRACTACRATKKRCDAAQPCRPCVKRGVGSSCTYSQHVRARRAPPNQSSAASGTRQRDQVSPLFYQHRESSLQDEDETAASSTSGKTVTPPGPRPVMMYTCSGEKGTISISSAASATILRRP